MVRTERRRANLFFIAEDVAQYLAEYAETSGLLVIAENPVIFLSYIKRHWNKIMRLTLNERAATLDSERIKKLTAQLTIFEDVIFSTKYNAHAQVIVIAPHEIATVTRENMVVCICCSVTEEQKQLLLHNIKRLRTCVDYFEQ